MKTILVPTDFSQSSLSAVNYAVQYSQATGCKLVFFHSTSIFIPAITSAAVYLESVNSDKAEKMKKLETFIEDAYKFLGIKKEETRIKLVVRYGDSPVDNILEMVQEQFVDMIIMGIHGASGLKKFIFGSNTIKTIEQATCPVLAIPDKFKFKGINKIVYAASDLNTLPKELKRIITIAREFDSAIDIAHLVEVNESKMKQANLDVDTILNKLIASLKYSKMQLYVIDPANGNIISGLKKLVENSDPDMLVMLTHKKGAFHKLFNNSKTKGMAFQIKIPLLAVKEA